MSKAAIRGFATRMLSVQSWLVKKFGFDPTIIITLLTALLPLLANCFKDEDETPAEAIDKWADRLAKKGKVTPPPRIRAEMKRQGFTDKREQEALFEAIVRQAALERTTASEAFESE